MPRIRGVVRSAYAIGEVVPVATGVLPFGTLFCDGSLVLVDSYPKLYLVLGTFYGSGTIGGKPAYRLPDFRSRIPLGLGQGVGLTNRSLGDQSGAESVPVDVAHLPSHGHSGGVTTSWVNGGGSPNNNWHNHGYTTQLVEDIFSADFGGDVNTPSTINTDYGNSSHTHSVSLSNAGSGVSHNNIQPVMIATIAIAFI
jgi:microcystin-dependent protein